MPWVSSLLVLIAWPFRAALESAVRSPIWARRVPAPWQATSRAGLDCNLLKSLRCRSANAVRSTPVCRALAGCYPATNRLLTGYLLAAATPTPPAMFPAAFVSARRTREPAPAPQRALRDRLRQMRAPTAGRRVPAGTPCAPTSVWRNDVNTISQAVSNTARPARSPGRRGRDSAPVAPLRDREATRCGRAIVLAFGAIALSVTVALCGLAEVSSAPETARPPVAGARAGGMPPPGAAARARADRLPAAPEACTGTDADPSRPAVEVAPWQPCCHRAP